MSKEEVKMKKQERNINWITVLWYIHLHFLGVYAFWLLLTEAHWLTVFYVIFVTSIACIGVTVGAHRYYAHQSFTATAPLRFFFVVAHTLAGVDSIYDWVLLHRMHHKYFGTDKDPYNFNKGFIYSHYLSNVKKDFLKNTELVKTIDMRDVESDGFVWMQKQFYWILFIFLTIAFPINVPVAYWNESLSNSFLIVGILRMAVVVNVCWLVNSAILVWGLKPTDKYPVDDFSVFLVRRSYWPNYHYIYPRDWKSSEFGKYDGGCGTILIKFLYELGWVNTLVTMSSETAREVLYKIATKRMLIDDAKNELEKQGVEEAIRQQLCYSH